MFGYDRLKNFIIAGDKKTVQKILNGIETMDRKDNKLTLVKIRFSVKAYKNLSNGEVEKLNDTARDFFYFIKSFADFLKVSDFLNIWMLEDPVQNTETVTCGIFQLYFYENLLNPKADSKIQNDKKLTKKTVETLLNELFSLDIESNEKIIQQYALNREITLQ